MASVISSSPRQLGSNFSDGTLDGRSEDVDTDQGEIGGWLLGLFDQSYDISALIENRDSELLRVVDSGQQDLRISRCRNELLDELADAADEKVVAQVHDEVVITEELLGDEDTVRETERCLLREVGHLDAQIRAVANGVLDLTRRVANDDADVGDTRVANGLQAIEQNRLVGNRHQLLCRRVGDGA